MLSDISGLFTKRTSERLVQHLKTYKKRLLKFPGGPVVKSPTSNAGHAGSIPGWGTKITYAEGHLSLCMATTGTAGSGGAHVLQLQRSPCAAMKDFTCCN